MTIPVELSIAIRNHITELEGKLEKLKAGWRPGFLTHNNRRKQKIAAMNHVLHKDGNVSLSDLDQQFPDWRKGTPVSHTYELLSRVIKNVQSQKTDDQGNSIFSINIFNGLKILVASDPL